MAQLALVFCGAAVLAGCNGQVYHGAAQLNQVGKDRNLKLGPDKKPIPMDREAGIIYYPRIQLLKKTVVTKKEGDDCTSVTNADIVMVADTVHPQRMWYRPGILETYTFNPTLSADGTFMSLSNQSTPDEGETFKNVASGVSDLVGAASKAATFGARKNIRIPGFSPPASVECKVGTEVSFERLTDLDHIPISKGP